LGFLVGELGSGKGPCSLGGDERDDGGREWFRGRRGWAVGLGWSPEVKERYLGEEAGEYLCFGCLAGGRRKKGWHREEGGSDSKTRRCRREQIARRGATVDDKSANRSMLAGVQRHARCWYAGDHG
jgi:hypothetical protein